jgi:hypothetical protein
MTTINTIEDLIKALDENPQWVEALRVRLLTRELIELPEKFAQFVTATNERFTRLEEAAVVTDQRLTRLETDVQEIRGDVKTIRDDLGVLKGAHARNAAHSESVLVAAELGFSLVRTLGFDDLLRITREANTADIPANQLRSFRRADLVMEVADQAGENCYLAVEVSYTIDERDTSRAVRNAEFLTAFTDRRAYPVVAGLRYDERVQTGIESGEMLWYEIDADSLEPE